MSAASALSPSVLLAIPLLPLIAAILAGLGGRLIGRRGAHTVTCLAVGVSCVLSLLVLRQVLVRGAPLYDATLYSWLLSDGLRMQVGFMIDRLSALMMAVVTFVSLCVHVYTIGYMRDDPGYTRFFSYISLFTFSMLMLVMANNFMQLFFGWEAVGLVSYLLIGFWYTRPSATFAALKAFLVNRIGDFGFVVGIAGIVYFTWSLDYRSAFAAAPQIAQASIPLGAHTSVEALTLICICLFIGAMGKSAQVPLHVWLPDSMEGPTPISALIHAATMVTAGIFMVARMSPLFEYSEGALSFVLVIGATTAFFMGLLGVVNNDIKRVIAYSTLSQLGYMTVALGVSAYGAAIFHLMTHAFFKALLFLAAGSVIIAMHHEQDMRRMGGLARYMPVTTVTCWIGALALIGTPFFSGFYSKDAIIEAVGASHRVGATYAYWCVLCGVFVTALYTFRMMFLTFHGPERFRTAGEGAAHAGAVGAGDAAQAPMHLASAAAQADTQRTGDHAHSAAQLSQQATHRTDVHAGTSHGEPGVEAATRQEPGHEEHGHPPHESPAVVTVPLIALAIPSVLVGALTAGSVLFGGYFGRSIFVLPANDVVRSLGADFAGAVPFALHGLAAAPFLLALAGAVTAWAFFLRRPAWADAAARRLRWLYTALTQKYWFDWINEQLIAPLTRLVGTGLWKGGDQALIDGLMVNGTAAEVTWLGGLLRRVQSGYLYSYAFWMMIGLALLLGWFVLRLLRLGS